MLFVCLYQLEYTVRRLLVQRWLKRTIPGTYTDFCVAHALLLLLLLPCRRRRGVRRRRGWRHFTGPLLFDGPRGTRGILRCRRHRRRATGSFGILAGKRARPGHSITPMGFSFSFQSARAAPARRHAAAAAAATSPAAVFLARALCSPLVLFIAPRPSPKPSSPRRPLVKGPAPPPHTRGTLSTAISTLPLATR